IRPRTQLPGQGGGTQSSPGPAQAESPASRPCRTPRAGLLLLLLSLLLLGCATGSGSENSPPRDIQAHLDLANSYLPEEPRKSLRELLPLQKRAGKIPEYQFLLGVTYTALDNCSKATRHLQQAVDLKPDYAEAWNNLGQAHAACEEYSEAETAFHKALELETYLTPEYPAYNLSRLYREQNEPEKALDFAKQAVDLNWRYLPAYEQLVDLLQEQGEKQKAVKWLRQAAEAFPDNTELLFRLAENELRLGNTEQARSWLQRILEVEPDSSTAQMARDYLDLMQE
ncbi:MAG: tetratricopeptide repeat protein, partial [Desulfohalobiaceae bacterium]